MSVVLDTLAMKAQSVVSCISSENTSEALLTLLAQAMIGLLKQQLLR